MTVLEVVFLLFSICIGVLCIFLERHAKRMADTFTERHLAYEAEKGKNLATKEDLQEITSQIEKVKAEISFESQQKKDFVVERKRHLLDILYYVEKIQYGQNRLQLYARNHSDTSSLYALNDEMNEALLELTHESHVILAEFSNLEGLDALSSLVDDASKMVAEIVVTSHNVANAFAGYNMFMTKAENEGWNQQDCINKARMALNAAGEYVKDPMPSKLKLEEDVTKYLIWLHSLFGKGLNFKYNLVQE